MHRVSFSFKPIIVLSTLSSSQPIRAKQQTQQEPQSFKLLILDDYLPSKILSTLLYNLHYARPTQKVVVLTSSNSLLLTIAANHLLVPLHSAPHQLTAILSSLLKDTTNQFSSSLHSTLLRLDLAHVSQGYYDWLWKTTATQKSILDSTSEYAYLESHRRALLQKSNTLALVGLRVRALRTDMIA